MHYTLPTQAARMDLQGLLYVSMNYTYAHKQACASIIHEHPLASRTYAHLIIGMSCIGTSLQQLAQTGRESKTCTKKQEHVLVVVRDVAVLRVLCKRCLHLVVVGELNRRFAVLRETLAEKFGVIIMYNL